MNRSLGSTLAQAVLAAATLAAATTAAAQRSATSPQAQSSPETIDINQASAQELAELPGIGPTRAEAIVAHRDRRPFRRPADLLRVRGIGRATFRALRERIDVSRVERTRPERTKRRVGRAASRRPRTP